MPRLHSGISTGARGKNINCMHAVNNVVISDKEYSAECGRGKARES